MRITKAFMAALLAGLLMLGCSSSEETGEVETAEETPVRQPTGEGVTIDYSLVVSGLPMLGEMTFNYQFSTDGKIGKMASESIIPAGDDVRRSKLAYVTDLDAAVQTYLNETTKTFASIDFPDPSQVPPSTSPEAGVQVNETGNVKEILGIECKEVDVSMEVTREGPEGPVTTSMSGKLWVSNGFEGYDLYEAFQKATQEAIGKTRLQGSGYFEFLIRSGFSRDNLDQLYEGIGAFPFEGTLDLAIKQGSSRQAEMVTKLEVTEISSDPIDPSAFGIPEEYTEVDLGQVSRPGN
jgi:hypothetical protein